MWSSMPAAMQALRSSPNALAVMARMGSRRPACRPGWARMARVAARPSMPGICTSISTRSGEAGPAWVASATAWAPPSASSTVRPTPRSSSAATSRLTGLSSTSSTRAPAWCWRSKASSALAGCGAAGKGRPWRCTMRSRLSCSDDALMGLTSNASKPTSRAAWRMPGSSCAVTSRLGGRPAPSKPRNWRRVSMPSIGAMRQSISSTS